MQCRVRDILQEYESPILNDLIFLTNYMLTTFNTQTTPLMKLLTGMELLLEKLGEWDSYSSRKLNSCHDETQHIKQLIIRYRKLQILSWRNLLTHRRLKMVREDFQDCVRLLHTIERQIFDTNMYRPARQGEPARRGRRRAANSSKNLIVKRKSEQEENRVELQIFELIDLFIRDSCLGVFESRLKFLQIVSENLEVKYELMLNN